MEETMDTMEAMKMIGVPAYSEGQWAECADKIDDVLNLSEDPVVRLLLAAVLISSVPKWIIDIGMER